MNRKILVSFLLIVLVALSFGAVSAAEDIATGEDVVSTDSDQSVEVAADADVPLTETKTVDGDDADAIQNAINSANAGDTINLGNDKTYTLDKTVTVNKTVTITGNNVTILGNAASSPDNGYINIVKAGSGTNISNIILKNVGSYLNLKYTGEDTLQGWGIYIKQATNCLVDNCTFYDWNHGVRIQQQANYNTVKNSFFYGGTATFINNLPNGEKDRGSYYIGIMGSTGCLVTDCLFQGPACDGVSIASGAGGNKVIRNKFNGTAYGIYFGGASTSNTLLADNTFINVGSFESDVYDKTTGDVKGHVKFIDLPVISVQKSADGFVIKNNTFYATTGNVLIAAQEGNTAHGYPSDMGNFNITENTVLAYDENVLMSTVVLCQIESNIGTLNPSGNIRIFDNTLNGAKVATYWSNEWFEDGKGLSSDVFIGAAEKVKTTFLIKSITPTKIEVVIQDAYGKPVYDSITDSKTGVTTVLTNIIVINNGVETIVQPDENGNFEIIAPVGTVSMNFTGNDKLAEFFLEITTSYEFMNNTSIKIVSVDKEKLVGKLVDAYDQPLAGKIVSYTIGTTTSGNITTGSDGTFVIDNPNGLIKLDFAKNGTYESSSNQVNYTNIPKTDSVFTVASSISLTAIETAAGEAGKTITLYIKDANGNVLANKNVKVVIGSTVNNVVSGNDGKISVLTKLSAAGNYPVSIVFLGDDNYNAAFAKSNIKVVKKSTTITPKKTSYKFKAAAKNKYITATLKTNNKYLKAGKKVTITIKGKTYSAKTGANGAIKLNLKNLKKKGTYKAKIRFAGDGTYNGANSKNIKIVIK